MPTPSEPAGQGATAERLREEFNAWQAAGRGATMARHHRAITEKTLVRMGLAPGDCVLDLGCGSGWATRRLTELVGPSGFAVGVDISDAMIAEANRDAGDRANLRYAATPADRLPFPPASFSHALSIESFYYYPDQGAVLRELQRVLQSGGRLFLLMCMYRGHPAAENWRKQLAVPVHMRDAAEYRALLQDAGFANVATETYEPAPDAAPDEHDYALLVTAAAQRND